MTMQRRLHSWSLVSPLVGCDRGCYRGFIGLLPWWMGETEAVWGQESEPYSNQRARCMTSHYTVYTVGVCGQPSVYENIAVK